METDSLFIVCTDSGTIIPFDRARLIDTSKLSDGDFDCFQLGGDREICDLAMEAGKPLAY